MTSLTYRLYIDGTWQDSEGDAVLTVLNPATEEVIGTVPDATAADVNRAVAAARRAFDEGPWPNFSPRERSAVMLRMADALERRAPELKELAVREAGSTRALADTLQVSIPLLHFGTWPSASCCSSRSRSRWRRRWGPTRRRASSGASPTAWPR